jgi:hypothetical protein
VSFWSRAARVLLKGGEALFGAVLDEITDHAAEPAPAPKREPLQQITNEELKRK